MNFRIIAAIALLVLFVADADARDQEINNIMDVAIPTRADGSSMTLIEIRDAIVDGCERKRWKAVISGNQQVNCSILVRGRHYAEVNISYTETSYSIEYADSRDLRYNEEKGTIHRNYNKWVILLGRVIDQQFI